MKNSAHEKRWLPQSVVTVDPCRNQDHEQRRSPLYSLLGRSRHSLINVSRPYLYPSPHTSGRPTWFLSLMRLTQRNSTATIYTLCTTLSHSHVQTSSRLLSSTMCSGRVSPIIFHMAVRPGIGLAIKGPVTQADGICHQACLKLNIRSHRRPTSEAQGGKLQEVVFRV